jgi:hypothetical protein
MHLGHELTALRFHKLALALPLPTLIRNDLAERAAKLINFIVD